MPKKPNNRLSCLGLRRQFVSAELNQVSTHFSACITLSVGFLHPGPGIMEHHFFLACFKINTDNLSIMSCRLGKTWSIFSLSQMSFNYALTVTGVIPMTVHLCKIRGKGTTTWKQLCKHYYSDESANPDETELLARRWQFIHQLTCSSPN